jgi:hypothetical protein
MPDSPILGFYRGERPDDRGRSLTAMQSWDDDRLEIVHDYIQWLFPLPERSAFNPGAPLLTPADMEAFKNDAGLRDRLLASFRRLLAFYGFALDQRAERPTITPAANLSARTGAWLHQGNHNLLRLTRILRCLTLLGFPEHARAFLAALERLDAEQPGRVGATAMRYWRDAVRAHPG